MHIYGNLDCNTVKLIEKITKSTEGMQVVRKHKANSSNPRPKSTDLEQSLIPVLDRFEFEHHKSFAHPRTGYGFEFDFFNSRQGIAMEIMGYRADDEIYKNLLKFHVHEGTQCAVVWVPKWKWISGKKIDVNYRATLKAAAFTEDYIDISGLIILPYDWTINTREDYILKHMNGTSLP